MAGRRRTAFVLALLGVAAMSIPVARGAQPPRGVVFAGETVGQRNPIVIEVDAARTRVVKLTWGWDAPCTLAATAPAGTDTRTGWIEYRGGYPINAAGAWRRTFSAETRLASGVSRAFTHRVAGRRSGGRMIGTLRSVLTERDAAGQIIRMCDSGAIRFDVAERHVYGGLTAQRIPMFVTMSPARTRVLRLRWDWQARCTLGPAARPDTGASVYFPDELSGSTGNGWPVRPTGHWGGSLSYPPAPDPSQPGISISYAYRISARRTGQLIRGTITASLTETDSVTLGVVRICASPPVRFTVKD